MKKIFSLFILCTLIVACNKKAATPAPTTAAPATTSTALTSLDSCMLGDWALDSMITYNNAAVTSMTPYTDPINCHLLMTSTETNPGSSLLWKNGTKGLECTNTITNWRITTARLDLGGSLYTILSSGSNKLVLQWGSITPTGGFAQKYYLHK